MVKTTNQMWIYFHDVQLMYNINDYERIPKVERPEK